MRLAVTATGDGWLSYSDNDDGHDFVLPLAAGEPAPPSPPSSGGGGTGTGAGAPPSSPGVATTRPKPPKGAGSGAEATVSGSLGHGLVGELSAPEACVPGGQSFRAKVAVKRKGSQSHKAAYTVRKVVFYLGKKQIATDRSKPFETSFATKGLGSGATLSIAAKITIDLHVGHRRSTVSKVLKTTARTCG